MTEAHEILYWRDHALELARRVGALRGTVMGSIVLLTDVDDVWARSVRKLLVEAMADDDRRSDRRERET